jgi:uncharacterized protein YbjT (DUF2867 family)
MSKEAILVTGATGTVGNALIQELSKAGAEFRAMVRNPAKGEALRGAGIETVIGDFDRPETLGQALAGVRRVFLLTAPNPAMAAQEIAVVEAARRGDAVRHIVKLSAFGADPNGTFLFRMHGEAEQAIRASGVPFTILRPNGFMQNVFASARAIREQSAIHASMGGARVSMVDVRDVAEVAALALTGEGHQEKTYELTGPEALSYGEVARMISARVGRDIDYVDVPPEIARTFLVKSGMSEWLADALIDLFAAYRQGAAETVTNTVAQVTGRPARTFEQFLGEFAGRFKT